MMLGYALALIPLLLLIIYLRHRAYTTHFTVVLGVDLYLRQKTHSSVYKINLQNNEICIVNNSTL